jgi:general secretion pathway protein G
MPVGAAQHSQKTERASISAFWALDFPQTVHWLTVYPLIMHKKLLVLLVCKNWGWEYHMRRIAGYTLIEVMIVMGIIGIAASLAYPSYLKYFDNLDTATVEADFQTIDQKMALYFASYGTYPPDLAAIGMDKNDPWGEPYQYLNMALADGNGAKRKDHNQVPINSDYDLYSKGPDGKSASPLTAAISQDDIIRANNGGYIGVASDY